MSDNEETISESEMRALQEAVKYRRQFHNMMRFMIKTQIDYKCRPQSTLKLINTKPLLLDQETQTQPRRAKCKKTKDIAIQTYPEDHEKEINPSSNPLLAQKMPPPADPSHSCPWFVRYFRNLETLFDLMNITNDTRKFNYLFVHLNKKQKALVKHVIKDLPPYGIRYPTLRNALIHAHTAPGDRFFN